MTTIAYRDGVLATDSLVSSGNERAGYTPKAGRKGRLLFAGSGSSGLIRRFAAWLMAGAQGDPPALKEGEHTAGVYVFLPDDRVVWFYECGHECLSTPFWAAGSGGHFAKGAMAMGAIAEEAVRIAIQHDTGSGGDICILRRAA